MTVHTVKKQHSLDEYEETSVVGKFAECDNITEEPCKLLISQGTMQRMVASNENQEIALRCEIFSPMY